jgi:4-nitrophenyl phosphatase
MRGCKIEKYEIFLIDLDGVVWRGREVIKDNVQAIRYLIGRGKKVAFLTNNSTRSRSVYAELLRGIGIDVNEGSVVTSGYAAALWTARNRPRALIYILGEEGLAEEAAKLGLRLATRTEALSGKVEAVIVGLDRNLTYSKLNAAFKAVQDGALFVAANRDPTFPLERGSKAPGAGSIVAALEAALGREPDFVAGKPNPWMVDIALGGRYDRSEVLVIGDRLETDILMANKANVDSVLVLTGVTTREEAERAKGDLRPTCILETLKEGLPDL